LKAGSELVALFLKEIRNLKKKPEYKTMELAQSVFKWAYIRNG
jgi:hypothetical protein